MTKQAVCLLFCSMAFMKNPNGVLKLLKAVLEATNNNVIYWLHDQTLLDLMQLHDAHATEKIFGGKIVVLGGDFWQISLVVPKGGREDIVGASLPRSHLWQHITILLLISTCESWQPIIKNSESLPNGCWMLETVVFLPLQKKKVSIQIGSRFHPIWGCQQKIAA